MKHIVSKKKKRSGHYCWVCQSYRPNEKFTGKGHKNHICKKCSSKPIEYLNKIRFKEEMIGYWSQKSMSKKNVARLQELVNSSIGEISTLANIMLKVVIKYPNRKKRISQVVRNNKELVPELEKVGLIQDWIYIDGIDADEMPWTYDEVDPVHYDYIPLDEDYIV